MTTATIILLILVLAVTTPLVYGSVQHIVGGNAGWSTVVNYSVWSAGQNFTVNDSLVFNYDTKYSVDQVNETEYNTCNSTHPLKTYTGGNTVITLSDPRELYFICPTPGLCARGMKLAVKVDQSNITSSGTARSLIATADLKLGFLLVLVTILSFMD
ncbi:mavicyanin-like [Quercus lobata]|uniref:mavicyanin-like n=1 Tax=Quercus lobata TaxID=97700 RepID=UPI00124812A9|nr:mavicyanin-like [Quercus lobata]